LPLLPPLRKGGWGGFLPAQNCLSYLLQDSIGLQQHVPVIVPQHQQTFRGKALITLAVAFKVFGFQVLAAVNLNHQPGAWGKEIQNVGSKRFLSIKLDPMQLFPPQTRPEQLFRIGHIPAQVAGWGFQVFAVSAQRQIPLNPPFIKGDLKTTQLRARPPLQKVGVHLPPYKEVGLCSPLQRETYTNIC